MYSVSRAVAVWWLVLYGNQLGGLFLYCCWWFHFCQFCSLPLVHWYKWNYAAISVRIKLWAEQISNLLSLLLGRFFVQFCLLRVFCVIIQKCNGWIFIIKHLQGVNHGTWNSGLDFLMIWMQIQIEEFVYFNTVKGNTSNYVHNVHKTQVRRPRLLLRWTCRVEQSPRRAPPYYWHWFI